VTAGLSPDAVLAGAPERWEGYFVVPAIIGDPAD
jgi:Asp-tRNA(Asn)/Glu-tRNA(Gln) amidotransferase C subunit